MEMVRNKRKPKKVSLVKANIVNHYFTKRVCGQKVRPRKVKICIH